jgi:hypothetical protein
MKIVKPILYEEIDEQQDLIANFHMHPREEYLKRAKA